MFPKRKRQFASLAPLCFIALFFVTSPSEAQQPGCPEVVSIDITVPVLVECINEAKRELLELRSANDTLSAISPIPQGAVLAFDLANGCPEGWLPMSDLDGRVIVSAGANRAAKYGYRDIGGEEKHTLTVGEMPRHHHNLPTIGLNDIMDDPQISAVRATNPGNFTQHPRATDPNGGDQAHNNMPPYIALYFCKKE